MTPTPMERMEAIVDEIGLAETLIVLAATCQVKADHISETWQDIALTDKWERHAARIAVHGEKARQDGLVGPEVPR